MLNNSHIDPTAKIAPNVAIGEDVYIGAYCCIGFLDYQSVEGLSAQQIAMASPSVTRIDSGCRIFQGCIIGNGAIIGKNVRMDAYSFCGANTRLNDFVVIEYGGRVYNGATIGEHSSVGGFICNDARIGRRCNIQGGLIHPRKQVGSELPPTIEDDVLIGTGALVIGKIVVAQGSFLAANSVLTQSTNAGKMYKGAPARLVGPSPNWQNILIN